MTEEAKLKKAIKDWLDTQEIFWTEIKGGAHSKPGDPDLVACVDGMFLGIEAKTATGRVSDAQYLRAHQIVESGGMWICARSVADVADACREARQRLRWHGD